MSSRKKGCVGVGIPQICLEIISCTKPFPDHKKCLHPTRPLKVGTAVHPSAEWTCLRRTG